MSESKIIEAYNKGITEVIDLVKGLSSQINVLNTELSTLKAENKKLSDRLTEVEERINKNSSNSSKPPSSDGFKKPKSFRKKSGKPTGGQFGHEGHTLEKVENPDEIVDIKPEKCKCGYHLSDVEGITRSRQVFEMPVIKVKVTEYRAHEVICPKCNKVHKTKFPDTVTQPTQYGKNIQALMAYLTNYQFIPLERSSEIISDILGQSISEGTFVKINNTLNQKLELVEDSIKQQLINSPVVNFDESGVRCNGKTQWLHSASTDQLTHYAIHEKRGSQASYDIGILPEFEGVACHDHWIPYYNFNNCSHSECNSHILRALKGISENTKYEWSQKMASLLIEIKHYVNVLKVAGKTEIADHDIAKYHNIYKEIIAFGNSECPMPTNEKGKKKPKKNASQKLLARLEKYDIETLSFMYDFNIPFDNNLAERDIRMIKLKQKISGGFRGKDAPNVFCRIRGYISTCRKNGQKVMESIAKAIKGDPYIPSTL